MKSLVQREHGEEGFAMYVAVIVAMLLFLIAGSALQMTVGNLSNSREANDQFATHIGAEAGADEFYAALNADVASLGNWDSVREALSQMNGVNDESPSYWAQVTEAEPEACLNALTGVCYHISADLFENDFTSAQAASGGGAGGLMLVTVQAVTDCPQTAIAQASDAKQCVMSTVEERLAQRNFFDYLYFDNYETLDPALYPIDNYTQQWAVANCEKYLSGRNGNCKIAALLGSSADQKDPDIIDGPIHTNDSTFYYCNNVEFNMDGINPTIVVPQYNGEPAQVESTGDGAGLTAECSPMQSLPVMNTDAPVMWPAQPSIASSTLAQIANPQDQYPEAAQSGDTFITLNGSSGGGSTEQNNTYSVAYGASEQTGPTTAYTTHAWPATGLIYVSGDVFVRGEACLPVSVASTGSIYVDGDLVDQANCNASIGLEANNAVIVTSHDRANAYSSSETMFVGEDTGTCAAAASAGRLHADPYDTSTYLVNTCEGRTIDAAILALGANEQGGKGGAAGGSFYVQGWDTAQLCWASSCSGSEHYLNMDGSVTSQYRGAYGAYEQDNDKLTSGWLKNFTYDQDLQNTEPPYFLQPSGSPQLVDAGWVRTDESDVPNN